MKAVVLEVKNNKSVVLMDDGTIEKINKVYEVGQEIDVKPSIVKFPKKYLAIAASFALAFILGAGGYVYAAPTSYVTMDARLSFEFGLNAFDEVVSIVSLNPEGEKIVADFNNLSSFHPTIDEAVALTSELLYDANYLSSDSKSEVIISAVSSDANKSAILSEKAKNAVSEVSSKRGATSEVAAAIASPATREQAMSEGKSTGQYIVDGGKNSDGSEVVIIATPSNSTTENASTGADAVVVSGDKNGSEEASEAVAEPATAPTADPEPVVLTEEPTVVDNTDKNAEIIDTEKNSEVVDVSKDASYSEEDDVNSNIE